MNFSPLKNGGEKMPGILLSEFSSLYERNCIYYDEDADFKQLTVDIPLVVNDKYINFHPEVFKSFLDYLFELMDASDPDTDMMDMERIGFNTLYPLLTIEDNQPFFKTIKDMVGYDPCLPDDDNVFALKITEIKSLIEGHDVSFDKFMLNECYARYGTAEGFEDFMQTLFRTHH